MHAYVHKNVHNSTVYNSSQLEKIIVHLPQNMQTNWYIYTMKYHATIKVNELLLHARTWMNLTVWVKSYMHGFVHIKIQKQEKLNYIDQEYTPSW